VVIFYEGEKFTEVNEVCLSVLKLQPVYPFYSPEDTRITSGKHPKLGSIFICFLHFYSPPCLLARGSFSGNKAAGAWSWPLTSI